MADKSCGTCAAWHPTTAGNGECRLTPPQTIFMGFQPPRLTGQPPQPLIAAAFPAVQATAYCHQWTPTAEEMATGIGWRQTSYEVDENGVGNLVTRSIDAAFREPRDVPSFNEAAALARRELSAIHIPIKRNGEWKCERCGVSEDVFEAVECKEKSNG